ncbi:MAG TPA: hypothetical protein VEY06_14850 [Flavisolibacter sp.]|nr:hypothetical protein [Flavisolibacter sp.]
MNEQNFEYLKDNIKYAGFGETMFTDLQNGLRSGVAEFELKQSTAVARKAFDVTLHFRKSENTGMYFFNSYHASLQRSNGETKDQVFYLTKGKGVTAKEAFNLLEGRAVYKELSNKAGAPYKAWIQLDFDKKDKGNNHEVKQFHEAYGYDLKAALSRFAISDLDGGEREKSLLQSLHKGNIQSVALCNESGVQKMFIEANPQYKTVNLYDSELKRVPKEALGQYLNPSMRQEAAVNKEQGQDQRKNLQQKETPIKKMRSEGSHQKASRSHGPSRA